MQHLEFILKYFDDVATSRDKLLIWYFRDCPRPFIRTQLDEKNRDLDNWQAIIKRVVDSKAKAAQQDSSLVQDSNVHYLYAHISLKHKKSKNQKNSEIKKNHSPTTNNNSGNDDKSGLVLD